MNILRCIYNKGQTPPAATTNLLHIGTIVNPFYHINSSASSEKNRNQPVLSSSILSHWVLEFSIMPNSLCFRQAHGSTKGGPHVLASISEEEWMWHLVMHMCNARHPADSTSDPITMLIDPVGNSIRVLALNNDYEPLKGKTTSHLAATSNLDHQRRVRSKTLREAPC